MIAVEARVREVLELAEIGLFASLIQDTEALDLAERCGFVRMSKSAASAPERLELTEAGKTALTELP